MRALSALKNLDHRVGSDYLDTYSRCEVLCVHRVRDGEINPLFTPLGLEGAQLSSVDKK